MKFKNFSNTLFNIFNILIVSSLLLNTNINNIKATENIRNGIMNNSEIENFNNSHSQFAKNINTINKLNKLNKLNNNKNVNIGFVVFSVLLGEIALQKGNLGLSSDTWQNLAMQNTDLLILERATEIALANNQPQRALNLVNQWLKIDPTNEKASLTQISILFLSQKFDDLLPILQQRLILFANQPKQQRKIINFVNKLIKNNTANFSYVSLRKINKLVIELSKDYENFAETQSLLATSFFILSDKENAIKHLKKAISFDENNEQAVRLLSFLIYKDFPRESEKILSNFLQKNPNATYAILVRSELYKVLLSQKKLDEAYQQIQILLKQNNVAPNFIFALAVTASSTYNENDFAIKVLTQLLQEQSVKNNTLLSNLYNITLANFYVTNNAENQAVDTLYKVKFIDDNAKNKFINLYKNSLAKFNNDSINNIKEEQFLNEVLSNNYYLNARISLAELLNKQNKTNEARAILQQTLINADNYDKEKVILIVTESRIIAENSEQQAYLFLKNSLKNKDNKNLINDADFLYTLALFAGQNNNNAEMERLLKRLIKANPEHSAGLNALGYYYVDANIKSKFKLAEQYILKALEINNKKDPYIVDSLGWLHYRKGDFNKAYESLNFAYNNAKEAEIGVHLLQVLQVLKNKANDETDQQKYAEEFDKVYNELNTNFANDKIFIKYKNKSNKSKKFQKK